MDSPYYTDKNVTLYDMDCIQFMEKSGRKADLTVTSPPYNIGKEYEKACSVGKYLEWCVKWLNLVHKMTKNAGAIWLNLGYFEMPNGRAVPIPYLLWDRTEFYLIQEIVWHYMAGTSAKRHFAPRNEKFLWYVKDEKNYTFNLDEIRDKNVKYPNQKKRGRLRCNPLGKNPTNVWDIPKITSGANRSSPERTAHPAQFPLKIIDRIILACSNPGDTVFDPFIGSGTTAVSAARHGRKVIGCDTNKNYLDMAIKRLSPGARNRAARAGTGHGSRGHSSRAESTRTR